MKYAALPTSLALAAAMLQKITNQTQWTVSKWSWKTSQETFGRISLGLPPKVLKEKCVAEKGLPLWAQSEIKECPFSSVWYHWAKLMLHHLHSGFSLKEALLKVCSETLLQLHVKRIRMHVKGWQKDFNVPGWNRLNLVTSNVWASGMILMMPIRKMPALGPWPQPDSAHIAWKSLILGLSHSFQRSPLFSSSFSEFESLCML